MQNLSKSYSHYQAYISLSPVMQSFLAYVHKIASFPVDVLLQGETGSGKDYFAEYLHQTSQCKGAFMAINCAAIPESLAEAELFGVEVGAFTGAQKRIGKIEAANGGTLYLDEIDSMPLHMQAKLLRALQSRGCERIGSNKFIASQFRVIASTKVNLLDLVEKRLFREDLYYRLSTIHLCIPSLRQRQEDIMPLFEHYCAHYAKEFKVVMNPVDHHLTVDLLAYTWQGNIRELLSFAQRYVLGLPLFASEESNLREQEDKNNTYAKLNDEIHSLKEDGNITQNASIQIASLDLGSQKLKDHLKMIEKALIIATLEKHQGSLTKASAELGLPIPTLHYRMKQLGVEA